MFYLIKNIKLKNYRLKLNIKNISFHFITRIYMEYVNELY